jgi:hypothetical protein
MVTRLVRSPANYRFRGDLGSAQHPEQKHQTRTVLGSHGIFIFEWEGRGIYTLYIFKSRPRSENTEKQGGLGQTGKHASKNQEKASRKKKKHT